MDRRTLPKKPMHPNSVTLTLRVLSTFFNELENNDEILKSPFCHLSKTRRQNVLSEHYDDPYSLKREEFMTIMNAEVPDDLKEVKDVFLLQCALGYRISDFMRMNISNVSVSDEGIPYVHYVAKKTTITSWGRREKTTPLMLLALDIIKRYDFRFLCSIIAPMANWYITRESKTSLFTVR